MKGSAWALAAMFDMGFGRFRRVVRCAAVVTSC
jgi:hypothetical protein